MGFFSDLRDDLSQAVNELIPGEEAKKQAAEAKREDDTKEEAWRLQESSGQDSGYDADLSRMLDQMEELEAAEIKEEISAPVSEAEEAPHEGEKAEVAVRIPNTETAVLTVSTVINGDIAAKEDLEVKGSIVGNVEASGKLMISGAIHGNSRAAEICVEGARIDGELRSEGRIKIGRSSVVIGNVFAGSAMIAGAVKGDIDVKEFLVLDSSAIVSGNIRSKSLQINSGAVIEGACSQCYAEVNPSSFFEDLEKEK